MTTRKEIKSIPNGTMMYVAGILGGIASGSSRPPGFEGYFGDEGSKLVYQAFQKVDSLLTELNSAGVGSGKAVTVHFSA